MTTEKPNMAIKKIMEELASKLKNKKIAIFCGAGISIEPPSNLPSGWNLRSYILEKIIDENDNRKIIEELFNSSRYPFEAFIQAIDENLSIVEIFPLLFSKGKPNKNHFLIS